MVNLNDYSKEKTCEYKGELYLVRDNGAILRKARPQKRKRKNDDEWTFGKLNPQTGYLELASVPVHRIVAYAFLGDPPSTEYVVDHIDTNRQNNRPSNLRWLTRFENVVMNENTRKKIEYRTGVSIIEFLKNPSGYRDCFEGTDFQWMRTVSEEEAKNCLAHFQRMGQKGKSTDDVNRAKIGEWVFQSSKNMTLSENSSEKKTTSDYKFTTVEEIETNSLSILAKQVKWKTPTEFCCCPQKIGNDPIQDYYNNLRVGSVFSRNIFGETIIKKYALSSEKELFVLTTFPSGIKQFGLAKIKFSQGWFIHTNKGSFFTEEGAEKRFTIEQGQEWTGGDTFDDYC